MSELDAGLLEEQSIEKVRPCYDREVLVHIYELPDPAKRALDFQAKPLDPIYPVNAHP